MRYIIPLIIFCSFASASASGPGSTGGHILLLHSSAESASLSDSTAGIYGNLSAGQYNPAALPGLSGVSLELSHMIYFMDTFMTGFAYGHPIGPGGFGVRVKQFRAPDDERDYTGKKISGFDLVFTQYSLSGGVRVDPQQSLGAGVNIISEEYPGRKASSAGFDFGWTYLGEDGSSYGLTVRNVGRGMTLINENIPLPLEAAFAGMHPLGVFRFTWELFRSAECKVGARSGLQLSMGDNFRARLGLRYEGRLLFSSGFGISMGNWVMDYAFTPDFSIGMAHRVSMGSRL